MDSILRVTDSDLTPEALQDLTRDLQKTLEIDTKLTPILPEELNDPGAKGDPITLGTIILTALSSGTIVAMFNVLKSYFERKPSLEMKFKRGKDNELMIRAEHLDEDQIERTIELATEFFEV